MREHIGVGYTVSGGEEIADMFDLELLNEYFTNKIHVK